MADRPPRPEPHLGRPFRGGRSLVEHWLFGLGCCPGGLVQPLCRRDTAARKARSRGLHRPSTLLGPEGTAAHGSSSAGPVIPRPEWAAVSRDRPYLENCTVDASIICSCQVNKGTR
jgi:hypothetical protein